MADPAYRSGAVLELTVGAVAHGGHCVARVDDQPGGRVVFVRHALPGERVRARVTEDGGGSYCRADAVEVLVASPDRIAAPCPHAGPGRCGGCDWQHVRGAVQRDLKAAVVREQFARLARLDVPVVVEELPGGLLGWRTRTRYAVDAAGRPGLHRHRSHEVEPVEQCPLGVPAVGRHEALRRAWPGRSGVELAVGDSAEVTVLTHTAVPRRRAGRRPADRTELVRGPARLRHRVADLAFEVDATGFWQIHPAAPRIFAGALLDAVAPLPGEQALDLYAGAGLFTAVLAEAVGPAGGVVGVESDAGSVEDARGNLAGRPWASVRRARISPDLIRRLHVDPDVVVLDPPRAGVGADVMAAILETQPRAVWYLSCDPASLARDVHVAVAGDGRWQLGSLRAFDAFPMTQHIECAALLVRRPRADGSTT